MGIRLEYIFVFLSKNLVLQMNDRKSGAVLNLPARGMAPETAPSASHTEALLGGSGESSPEQEAGGSQGFLGGESSTTPQGGKECPLGLESTQHMSPAQALRPHPCRHINQTGKEHSMPLPSHGARYPA